MQEIHCRSRAPYLVTEIRRSVGGLGFEKMGVATLNMILNATKITFHE